MKDYNCHNKWYCWKAVKKGKHSDEHMIYFKADFCKNNETFVLYLIRRCGQLTLNRTTCHYEDPDFIEVAEDEVKTFLLNVNPKALDQIKWAEAMYEIY